MRNDVNGEGFACVGKEGVYGKALYLMWTLTVDLNL